MTPVTHVARKARKAHVAYATHPHEAYETDEAFIAPFVHMQPATRKAYIRDVRHFTSWYLRTYGVACDLSALTLDSVTRYRVFCSTRVCAGTFNRRRTALNHLASWALDRGLIAGNPVERVPCAKAIPDERVKESVDERASRDATGATQSAHARRWV